jgi:hypothetical protein
MQTHTPYKESDANLGLNNNHKFARVIVSYHIKLQTEVSIVFNKMYVKHRYENYTSIFLEILT